MVSPDAPRVAIITFGCKVNFFESEQLAASLGSYRMVGQSEEADIYIINGCTVTAAADAQVRSMARRLARHGATVIVTGCYARVEDRHRATDGAIKYLSDIGAVAAALGGRVDDSFVVWRARPVLKIEDGCVGSCAYCTIPLVRGSSIRSTDPAIIEKHLHRLAAAGYREVVLTGIHVGKYGFDRPDGVTLADIVEMAYEIIGRVRLSSIEPDEIDDRLLTLAAAGKILPHWHIPLQSGSNPILRAMRRSYDTALFAEKINAIYAAYPEQPAVGTDIIVGFPGETEDDFEDTCVLVSSLPLTYGHIFPFSPRRGTEAWEMHHRFPVPFAVKKRRARFLREVCAAKKRSFQNAQVGRTMAMILEKQLGTTSFEGTTDTYFQLPYRGRGAVRDLKKVVIKKEGSLFYAEEVERAL